jgi:hypothetical protein
MIVCKIIENPDFHNNYGNLGFLLFYIYLIISIINVTTKTSRKTQFINKAEDRSLLTQCYKIEINVY